MSRKVCLLLAVVVLLQASTLRGARSFPEQAAAASAERDVKKNYNKLLVAQMLESLEVAAAAGRDSHGDTTSSGRNVGHFSSSRLGPTYDRPSIAFPPPQSEVDSAIDRLFSPKTHSLDAFLADEQRQHGTPSNADTIGTSHTENPNSKCAQSGVQIALSGWHSFLLGIAPSMGSFSYCKMYDNDYCTVHPVFVCESALGGFVTSSPNVFVPPQLGFGGIAMGLCVSKADVCTTAELNTALFVVSTTPALSPETYIPLQAIWGYGESSLATPNAIMVNHQLIAPFECTNRSFTYLVAQCERDRPRWDQTTSGKAVGGVVLAMCAVVAIFTILSTINYFYKQYQKARATDPVEVEFDETTMLNVYDGSSLHNRSRVVDPELLPKIVRKICSWFSLTSSLTELVSVKNRNVGDVDTRFFEGLRVTAMLFVIYGHTLYFPAYNAGWMNTQSLLDFLNTYSAIGVYPAVLAVDVFFFLSGFLFMHLYLKKCEKQHVKDLDDATADDPEPKMRPLGVVLTLKMYLHRYLRLTPLVMMVLVCATWFFKYIPSGPLSSTYEHSIWFKPCEEDWWHQLLYITNLSGNDQWLMCMGWFWYMSCDMQLFILGPIIAACYILLPPLFYFLVLAGVVGSAAGGAHNLVFLHMKEYEKTWYRAAPYVYGFFAATLVRSPKVREAFKSAKMRLVAYFFSVAFIVSSVNLVFEMHQPKYQPDQETGNPFLYFAHAWAFVFWGAGLLLFSLPWALGHGGYLSRFFGHPVFAVASKLTFACYLIHPVVISIVTANAAGFPVFSSMNYYYDFAGFVVWAFLAAVCLWALVEYPFAKINEALTR